MTTKKTIRVISYVDKYTGLNELETKMLEVVNHIDGICHDSCETHFGKEFSDLIQECIKGAKRKVRP